MNESFIAKSLQQPTILSFNQAGIGDVDISDPAKPLEVLVGPLDMSQRDRIDLYWGDNPDYVATYTHSVDMPDTNGIFSLYVDTHWIKEGSVDVRYVYLPFPSNIAEPSEPASTLVKLSIPGGRDPDPATPYENEKLALPEVSPPGIIADPENVAVSLPAYDNMSVGDKITIHWNGLKVEAPSLTADQLNKPQTIAVPKEVILAAGDSENIVVRYEIRDVVNNWSHFSFPTLVPVEAGNQFLPAPIVPQAPDMEIFLEELNGMPVQVLVIKYPDMRPKDTIVLTLHRETAEGVMIKSYTAQNRIEQVTQFVSFDVPAEQFTPISGGRGRLTYKIQSADHPERLSKSLPLKIIGKPMEPLPPRVPVAEQNGGVLDPTSRNVVVEIPAYYFMAEGNEVNLVWMGKTASGANVQYGAQHTVLGAEVGKAITFVVPNQKVSVLAGGSVKVHYTVTTSGDISFPSPTLALPVSGSDTIELRAPTMDTVGADGVINPALIPESGATARVSYEGMRADDQVVVHWLGASSFDTPPQAVGSNTALAFTVPKAQITATQGRAATLSYSLQRNGVKQDSQTLALSVRSGMTFDRTPVTLGGKIYLIPGSPNLLPAFPADTTVTRVASGGQAPYTYKSSNNAVAVVDANGLASVRGNGAAIISVTDAAGESLSYPLMATGVIHCLGMGAGKWYPMRAACANAGGRLPTLDELREIYNAYGAGWPMGQGKYWSSTVAKNFLGAQWLYVKQLNNGQEFSLQEANITLCVALR